MAIEFVRHINGCFHVVIQPAGTLPKKNTPITHREFDLRGCEGEKIVPLSTTELKRSKDEVPSPTGDNFSRPVSATSERTGRRAGARE